MQLGHGLRGHRREECRLPLSNCCRSHVLHGRTATASAEFAAMPARLTDHELEPPPAPVGRRAHRARESAETISDPSLRQPVQE